MAYSVEARLPFLDHELVELCCSIPRRLRMRGFREKYVLRQAMHGLLPDEVRARRKRGTLSPLDAWMRAPSLPRAVADALSPERARRVGLFAPDAVRTLVDEHRSGAAAHGRELLVVAATHFWHDVFVDGGAVPEQPVFDDP